MQDSKQEHNKTIYDYIKNLIDTHNISEEKNNIEKKQMVKDILKYLSNPENKDKIKYHTLDKLQINNLKYDDTNPLILLTDSEFESFNKFLDCYF
jgi:hypothetical protein